MRPASFRNLLALAALTPFLSAQSSRPAGAASRPASGAKQGQAPDQPAAPGSATRAGQSVRGPNAPGAQAADAAGVRRDQVRREELHRQQVGRDLSALFVKLSSPSRGASCAARDAIIDLCSREDIAGLGYEAEKLYGWYRTYWAEQATAILELRLQKTTLLGFDTVPVSLGVGGTVRLQLPRTQSISIGTTVPVPLGTGR